MWEHFIGPNAIKSLVMNYGRFISSLQFFYVSLYHSVTFNKFIISIVLLIFYQIWERIKQYHVNNKCDRMALLLLQLHPRILGKLLLVTKHYALHLKR